MMFKKELQAFVLPMELRSQSELEQLKPAFVRTLSKELDVVNLSDRMCPVVFADRSAGVFVLTPHFHDDQTSALLLLIQKRGYRLAQRNLIAVSHTLLIAVTAVTRAGMLRTEPPPELQLKGGALTGAMNALLIWALENRASDIHFNVKRSCRESAVMFTIDGRYVCPERYSRLPTSTMLEMLAVTWMDVEGGNGAVFDPTIEQQGRVTRDLNGRRVCLRWASLATDQGPSVCLRLLILDSSDLTPGLTELGYVESQVAALQRASLQQGGAIIFAGTVGSGKSTTLATLMREIPPYRKVITLEDPAEYLIPNALQNTVSRIADETSISVFDSKLKAFKRSAMNDLLIGEIRDAAGGRAFSDLAGTGVSLYSTVHAGSALYIPSRLASDFIGVSPDLLATPGILKLLVFQCLLPKLCSGCSQTYDDTVIAAPWRCAMGEIRSKRWADDWVEKFERQSGILRQHFRFRREAGCAQCVNDVAALRGHSGRTVAAEFIEPGHEPEFLFRLKQRDGLALQRWFDRRARKGNAEPEMQGKSAQQCGLFKVATGLVDPRELERFFGVTQERICHKNGWSY
jgi:general secretion pathway protein E